MAKITKATLKSFAKKNAANLHIMMKSNFDGMYDCVMETGEKSFHPVQRREGMEKHTLGISGLWLVGSAGNSFYHYEDDKFVGIEVWNCCGSSIVAVPK